MTEFLKVIWKKELYLPILYIIIGVLIYKFINHLLKKSSTFTLKKSNHKNKRVATISHLIQNLVKYIITIFVILSILTVFGVDIAAILTGLGVVGVVLGLALQDIMKDFLSGFSIILEDQFEIGDTISIDGFMGEVIGLSLKTTKIKSYEGAIKLISNRNVTNIINYSAANSIAIVDIDVSYENNSDETEKVLNNASKKMMKELPSLKGEVKLLGINALKDSAITYRFVAETISMEHYNVARQMRKIIKEELDKNNIKIPYPQLEIHHGE